MDKPINEKARLAELISRWHECKARGETVSAAELCHDCPDLLPELERQLAVLQRLNALAPANETATLAPANGGVPAAHEIPTLDPKAAQPPTAAGQGTADNEALTDGPSVPGYELLGVLGKGGMGVVYKARQRGLGRVVALKMILHAEHAGEQERQRFQAEAEAVARLQHPNIVQIYEVDEHRGLPYFSLEFCAGGSLETKLSGTPLPPLDAARLVQTLAEAMQTAHDKGILHRDLKPANVLLAEDGTLKITDFGLAKKLGEKGQTQTGSIMGTPSYMAPEQAGGKSKEIGPAADIYALGAILYELLTGRPPFKAATALDTVLQVISDEPVSVRRLQPKVPRDLETICLKCLHKEPSKRYTSAEALKEDLQRFLDDVPILARPAGRIERGWRWCKRNRAVAISLAAVVIALLGGSIASTLFALQAQHNAEEASEMAEQARQEKIHAEKAAEAARRAESHANGQEVQARQLAASLQRNLYGVQFNAARKNLDNGLIGIARDQLERLRPARPGDPDLRGFEWHHLYRHCLPADHQVLYGSGRTSYTLAWSPNGKLLASPSGPDFSIRLWDAASGQQLRTLSGHQGTVYRVGFSPDGTRLVSAGDDGTLRIWRVANGRELQVIRASDQGLRCVAWRPDGKEIASTGVDGAIHVWNAATGESIHRWKGPQSPSTSIAYSPDGKQIATGSDNKNVCLWDGSTGKRIRTFSGHTDPIYEVAFSPDGKLLGSAAADATARLWNVTSGDERLVLRGHGGFVRGIAFSPDGKQVATACDDRLIRTWETKTGKKLRTFAGHGGLVWPVAFQPGGKRLASGSDDLTLRIWDLEREPGVRNLVGAGPIVFSPDGRQLGSMGLLGRVVFNNLDGPGQALTLRGHWGEVVRILTSRDRRYYATLGSADGTARLWDAASGKSLLVVHDQSIKTLLALALDPLCKHLATSGVAGPIRIWDATPAADGKERIAPLRELHSPTQVVLGLDFSPDGRLLASADADNALRLWDVATGKLVRECRGHNQKLWTVAFHPNGKEIASAGDDRKIIIWEVATGRRVRTLHGFPQRVVKIAYSPDGERLISLASDVQRLFTDRDNAPGEIKIWDARTGEELFADRGFARAPWELAFGPDGRRLVVGSQGTVFEKDLRLYESAETVGKTDDWPMLYRDAFTGAAPGRDWKVETGQWLLQDGVLRGSAVAKGEAALDLRGVDLPDTVEVRYELWMTHAVRCECQLLDRDARRGVRVNLGQEPGSTSNREITFTVQEQNADLRIGGVSGITLEPGHHYQVRLIRQGKWLSLWIDGREVAAAVAPDRPQPLLRFQANFGSEEGSLSLANLEIRAPTDAVRQRQLRTLVESAWEKYLLRDPVRDQLKTRKDLSTEERRWCLEIVEQFAEDPERLNKASWTTVCKSGLKAEEYALALRQAQAAYQADPDHVVYVDALGLAQMRAGQNEQAITTLKHAAELARIETGAAKPAHYAGLAMAYQRLGQIESARDYLHRLRDLRRGDHKKPADDEALETLLAEATALVAEPKPAARDEEAIKNLVIDAENKGWIRRQLSEYLAAHTDDVRVCIARSEEPGPYDVVLDRRQLEAVRRLQFQGPPPPPWVHLSFEDMQVRIRGNEAELLCRFVSHIGADYQVYGSRYQLRRTPNGWRISAVRGWLEELKQNGQRTVNTPAVWAKRDAEVDRLAKSNDLIARIRALKEAHRLAEAYALACQFTDREPKKALAWSLRGEMAVETGTLADLPSSFNKALSLDPGVEVPWYLTRQRLVFRDHQAGVGGLAFHPDGRRIVSGGGDKLARLWDSTTGRELRRFAGHEQSLHCAAFSPDGKLLATGGENLRLWDVETGQQLHACPGHTNVIYRLAFSPDGQRIVTASEDRTARIWDVRTGKQIHVMTSHTDSVLGAAFSRDGRWLATASHDQTARLWDAQTFAEVHTFRGHTGIVKRIEFSPDSKHLATSSGDRTIKLWNVATGKVERTLTGHDQLVDAVLFSPDGRRLASCDFGGTVRTWDTVSGKLRYVLRGHTGQVYVLSFRPDGQVLASGGSDGVSLWDLRPEDAPSSGKERRDGPSAGK